MNNGNNLEENIIEELLLFLKKAYSEQNEFIQKNAEKLIKWTKQLATGDLSQDEFVKLIEAAERKIRQNINTLEIQSRAKAEKILFGIIDVIRTRIL
jgi:hypothetical protein